MIRKYQSSDQEQVMHCWLEGNIQAHAFIEKAYWLSHYEGVLKLLDESEVYVMEKNQQICGFIGMNDSMIAGLFVYEKERCQGIGKALLDYVKQLKHVLYLTVYQKNQQAIRFYQREAFVLVKYETDQQTGEVELLMKYQSK